jgi:opacity protein-like surface antigen
MRLAPLVRRSCPLACVPTGKTLRAGVGIEHMLTANWTVKGEFRFVDFGTGKASCTPDIGTSCTAYRSEFGNTLKMGLIGLNYKF